MNAVPIYWWKKSRGLKCLMQIHGWKILLIYFYLISRSVYSSTYIMYSHRKWPNIASKRFSSLSLKRTNICNKKRKNLKYAIWSFVWLQMLRFKFILSEVKRKWLNFFKCRTKICLNWMDENLFQTLLFLIDFLHLNQ